MDVVTKKRTFLLSSKEVEMFLDKKISIEILDSWAKENSVFYDGTYIWSLDNLDDFLYEHFSLYEVLTLKFDKNFPLTEKEKKSIILNDNDIDLTCFYNKIPYDEIIEIKNKYSIPISDSDRKSEISEFKRQYEKNVVDENLRVENFVAEQKEIIRNENEKFNEKINATLNNYEKANISRLKLLSQPAKRDFSGCLIFLIVVLFVIFFGFLFFILF